MPRAIGMTDPFSTTTSQLLLNNITGAQLPAANAGFAMRAHLEIKYTFDLIHIFS
jgi:hypothetical protein